MRSTLLCLGLLAILPACSSGSGGTTAATPGNPEAVAKTQTRGIFTAEKETALGEYGQIPEGFELTPAITCGDQQNYDPRALAGDIFIEHQMSASSSSSTSSTVTSVIQTVDAKRMSESISVSNIASMPAIPGNPTSVQVQSSCTITEDKDDPVKCDIKYLGWQPPENSESLYEHCEADYGSNKFAKTTGQIALGKFKMPNGQSVLAQFARRENSNVDIKCGKGENKALMGTGTIISEDIVTRELVTRDAFLCTPTVTIVRKLVFQLDDGRVLSASLDEITQAPKR